MGTSKKKMESKKDKKSKDKKDKKEKKQDSDSEEVEAPPKKVEAPNSDSDEKDDAVVDKSRAWPKADNKMGKELLDLINQAKTLNQLKKGANETTKALNRGVAELIILA